MIALSCRMYSVRRVAKPPEGRPEANSDSILQEKTMFRVLLAAVATILAALVACDT